MHSTPVPTTRRECINGISSSKLMPRAANISILILFISIDFFSTSSHLRIPSTHHPHPKHPTTPACVCSCSSLSLHHPPIPFFLLCTFFPRRPPPNRWSWSRLHWLDSFHCRFGCLSARTELKTTLSIFRHCRSILHLHHEHRISVDASIAAQSSPATGNLSVRTSLNTDTKHNIEKEGNLHPTVQNVSACEPDAYVGLYLFGITTPPSPSSSVFLTPPSPPCVPCMVQKVHSRSDCVESGACLAEILLLSAESRDDATVDTWMDGTKLGESKREEKGS